MMVRCSFLWQKAAKAFAARFISVREMLELFGSSNAAQGSKRPETIAICCDEVSFADEPPVVEFLRCVVERAISRMLVTLPL
jgi:hypothetical protein